MSDKAIVIFGVGLFLLLQVHVALGTGGSISDPTKPDFRDTSAQQEASSAKAREKSWNLSCIIHSSSRRLAVINGEILNIGDSVKGGKVLDINPNSVILSYKGKRKELRLIEEMHGNRWQRTGGKQ